MWGYRRHTPSVILLTFRDCFPVYPSTQSFLFCVAELKEGPEASHPTINGLVRTSCATAHMHPSLFEREPPYSTAWVKLSVVIFDSTLAVRIMYLCAAHQLPRSFFKLIRDRADKTRVLPSCTPCIR